MLWSVFAHGQLALSLTSRNTTCQGSNGYVFASATGGTSPYQFSINGGPTQSGGLFPALAAGGYTVRVTDATGQTRTKNATLTNQFNRPQFSVSSNTPPDCDALDGTVTISATDGTAPYSYSADGLTYQPTNVLDNLSAGTYILRVKDANNCLAASNFVFSTSCAVVVTTSGPVCGPNGTITVTPKSTTNGPYSFSLDGTHYQDNGTFTGKNPGSYHVYSLDNLGNVSVVSVIIQSKCTIQVTATSTQSNCANNNGTIEITSGGTPPLFYSVYGQQYQESNILTGLKAGLYTVQVSDASGNTGILTGVVVNQYCPTLTLTATPTSCAANTGTIVITGTTGNGPFTFSIDGTDFQSSMTFPNLAAGSYTVTSKDANNVLTQSTANVGLSPSPEIDVTTQNSGCTVNNGTITAVGKNGKAPYSFSLNNGASQTSGSFKGLAPGSYTVTVVDDNGCSSSQDATVEVSTGPTLTLTTTDASCVAPNGTISVTANGGLAPYSYRVNNGTVQTSGTFSKLGAGSYTVKVSDANGCVTTSPITVKTTTAPLLTVTATEAGCTVNNGSLLAQSTGGLGPFSYSLNNGPFQVSGNFPNLSAGSYSLEVKDANGCVATKTPTVPIASGPTLITTPTAASCNGNDGAIAATGSGGATPFKYRLDNNAYQTSGEFTDVTTGNHTITISDANGCTATNSLAVPTVNNISIDAGSSQVICYGQSVVLSGKSSATPQWTPSQDLTNPNTLTPTASPKSTTKYYLTATKGVCTKIDSLIVTVNPLPTADAGKDLIICTGQSAQLNGEGGTSYTWTPSIYLSNDHIRNPTVVKPDHNVTYQLSVRDANGCASGETDSVTITVTPPPNVSAGKDTAIVVGQPAPLHAHDVDLVGFVSYSWNPAASLNVPNSQNPIATPTTSQVYTVTATTQAGCIGTDEIKITVFLEANIFAPNAFTPNGDGKNDVFRVIPVGIKTFKTFAVFNRYGQKVFATDDPGKGWDGRIGSLEQNTAGYVWYADGIDFNGVIIHRQGTVIVVR